MSLDELFLELRKLNRSEKLKAMQLLVNDLATEENTQLLDGTEYELSSPYGNEAAAEVLWQFLQANKGENS